MSLYSVSICASWPSLRASISARTFSSTRSSERASGADQASASAPMRTAMPCAPKRGRVRRGSVTRTRPASTPATPSVMVIARVPMAGIRKNVVPRVPTMLPAVETP